MNEKFRNYASYFLFGLAFLLLFKIAKSCNDDVKTVSERLPVVAVTDAKQNNEIEQLRREVKQLKETYQELTEKIRKIDSVRIRNYSDAKFKSNQQHFSELSDRYTKQKANR